MTRSTRLPNKIADDPYGESVSYDALQMEQDVLKGEDMDAEAQRALQERPSLSIRARLILGFLLFFFLSAAATLMAWYTFHRLERRLHFLELADRYTFEIQQARRFEKNYFLYGTNFDDLLDHVAKAERLLFSGRAEFSSVIGKGNFKTLEEHFKGYKQLLVNLAELDRQGGQIAAPQLQEIESELRRHGAEMVSVALSFASKERGAVNLILDLFKRLPIIFLGVLLGLVIYTANFLARQILGPLTRLMKTTQRIAQGDFSPHMPARRYKDEFTDLAVAINRMTRELLHHQRMLIESQKLQALGTLTAGVAHELNNPLGNISTSCQILMEELRDQVPEYHRGLLSSIENQVIRARDIVRALLEFSRDRDFELKPMELGHVVQDTLRLIKGEIPAQVEIQVEVPAGIVLDLDKAYMERALLNLVMNGLQAMEDGGLLTIRAAVDRGSGEALLAVSDTGAGIPEEDLHRIFEPFFTTKEVGRGTGLGLSVTYGIIKRHHGRITVESDVGKGTRFEIHLPLRERSEGSGGRG